MRIIFTFFILLIACQPSTENKSDADLLKKENEKLKEQLKEKEVKKNSNENNENIIGIFFVPHAATLNIRFYRSKKFLFNDYNSSLEKEETLTGTYQLEGNKLTLFYDDRPKQTFTFKNGHNGDGNFYIVSKDYYFVKGENGQ